LDRLGACGDLGVEIFADGGGKPLHQSAPRAGIGR
jgi:hypothetical protein